MKLTILYQLYSYFSNNASVKIQDVADLFGVHRTTIWRNMRKLELTGVIRSKQTGDGVDVAICKEWDGSVEEQAVIPRKPQEKKRTKRSDVARNGESRERQRGTGKAQTSPAHVVSPMLHEQETRRKPKVARSNGDVAQPLARAEIYNSYKQDLVPQLVSGARTYGGSSSAATSAIPSDASDPVADLVGLVHLPDRVSRARVRYVAAWIRDFVDLPAYLSRLGVRVWPTNRSGENPCHCPLHHDRHPSFYANRDKGIWYCHACDVSGDAIEMVQQMRGLRFGDAARYVLRDLRSALTKGDMSLLHGRAQDALTAWTSGSRTPRPPKAQRPKTAQVSNKLLLETRASQAERYVADLTLSSVAKKYLHDRGVTEETIAEYGIGFDRETGRLAVPNRDPASGGVRGFTYRVLGDAVGNRYENTANDTLYCKSSVLYGLHESLALAKRQGKLHIGEGAFDAWAMKQSGLASAAMQASHLSPEQVQVIKELIPDVEVVLIRENDEPGIKGLAHSVELLESEGVRFSVRNVPAGYKDVDEYLRKERYSHASWLV